MEQLISLTVFQKRDKVLTTPTLHVFDVDDIISPVRFADSKSYFAAKSKTAKIYNSSTTTDFRVNETLDEIEVKSGKLIKLSVVNRDVPARALDEDMLFNVSKVCETMYASTNGTSFLYNEEGNPQPMLYEVSNTIEEIINASMLSGAVSWKKVTKTYADFATDDVTNEIEVYTAKPKEMIHAVHQVHTESFDSQIDDDDDIETPDVAAYTQYDISTGVTGNTDKYAAAVDVLPAPDGVLSPDVITAPEVDMNDPVVIVAEAIADADLDLANQGIVVFYILTSKLP